MQESAVPTHQLGRGAAPLSSRLPSLRGMGASLPEEGPQQVAHGVILERERRTSQHRRQWECYGPACHWPVDRCLGCRDRP